MLTKIIIDNNIMQEYKKAYFKLNPKARKFPEYFSNPIPVSWNFFIAQVRESQAVIKKKV